METCRSQIVCYNCFQQRDSLDGPCPHCGFDLAENEKKYPVALRAGTVLNGRYIVGRVLGQGGFGITYLAWDTQLEAKVAIKEFMPNEIATRIGTTVSVAVESRSEDFTYGSERFQEEARTLAKFIGNPNIAAVTSYFDENDTSYFVMDYIEGISFKTYIANHGGKVSVEDTLNVMIPVLRALTAVHQEGFIHRDVTPDNIYITKDGMVKLLDFGSARYSIGDKSKSLDVILKVGYAPKEQYIRRSRQGPFTDVYSCAACFYAALTGFLPPEALERLDHDELVPVSQCGVDIPEYLDKAILKGLAVQPEDRFQSAEEFLNAIESQQVVEVPQAGSAQPGAPAKKKLSPVLIGGVAAAVLLVAGIGFLAGRGGNPSQETSGSGGEGVQLLQAEVPSITIQGQEYSTDLTELDLSGMGLSDADIEPLRYMVNLEVLNLNDNNLSDLSPLADLHRLVVLRIGGYNADIADLSPLENLTALEDLALPPNSKIQDLSPLSGLTSLQYLFMEGTWGNDPVSYIQDLSPLSNLTQLTEISLSVADGTDISPLKTLTNLKELSLNGELTTPSRDLSVLSNMTRLQSVSLHSLDVDTLDGIEGAVHLRNLFLSNYSGVKNLAPLSGLTDMQSLNLWVDGDVDLSPLENMKKLQELNLYGGENITDRSPIAHVPNVTLTY